MLAGVAATLLVAALSFALVQAIQRNRVGILEREVHEMIAKGRTAHFARKYDDAKLWLSNAPR